MLSIPQGPLFHTYLLPVGSPVSARREITTSGFSFPKGPSALGFTPDERWLVYTTREGLFSLRLDVPSTAVRLWADPQDVAMTSINIDPTGTQVIYVLDPIVANQLRAQTYIVPITGPESQTRLVGQGVTLPYLDEPEWAANGAYLLFRGLPSVTSPRTDFGLYSVPFSAPESTPVLLQRWPFALHRVVLEASHVLVFETYGTDQVSYVAVQGPESNRLTFSLGVPITTTINVGANQRFIEFGDGLGQNYSARWMGDASSVRRQPARPMGLVGEYQVGNLVWTVVKTTAGGLQSSSRIASEQYGPECRIPTALTTPTPVPLPPGFSNRLYLAAIGVCS